MSVKINGHTIASKLRKMFSSNGQTVASNLDGEMPRGGGGPLIVTFSGNDDNGNAACDKTFSEILAAWPNVRFFYDRDQLYELALVYDVNDHGDGDFIAGEKYVFYGDTTKTDFWQQIAIYCSVNRGGTVQCGFSSASSD